MLGLQHPIGRGPGLEGEDVEDRLPREGAPVGLVRPLGEPARLLEVEVAHLGEQRLLPQEVAKGQVGVKPHVDLHAVGAFEVGRGRAEAGEAAGAAGEAPRVPAGAAPLPEVGRVPAHVGLPAYLDILASALLHRVRPQGRFVRRRLALLWLPLEWGRIIRPFSGVDNKQVG